MWLIVTVVVFFFARWLSRKCNTPLMNPLLISIGILIPLLIFCKIPFETYYADNQWISFLLQPAVVALAYPLYEQLPQIRNVVLNTAFGWPTIAVDTHIYRVSNRTKLAMGKTVDDVEAKLLKVIPKEFKLDVHHWLILHGRYTCVARKPRCGSCIIEDLCEFKEKTDV